MQLQGILKKIRFQKENKWGIYLVQFKDERNRKTDCTFTGVLPSPSIGSSYIFEGDFTVHPTYGEQFKFTACTMMENETADGAFALLTSGRFPGLGPKRAQAIVSAFGEKTLDVIRNDYKKLMSVPGIGASMANQIHLSMPDIGIWEQLRMLLKGVTDNAISKIYENYGADSISVIKKNPYQLINDIDGYSFLRADAIAASVGITGNNPLRVQAAIYHCLESASEVEGHCFIYASNLQPLVTKLIPDVSVEDIADAIKALTQLKKGKMRIHVDNDGAIYLYDLWIAEVKTAEAVKRLAAQKPAEETTMAMVEDASIKVMHATSVMPDTTQQAAVLRALNNSICVITGGPGTGKTTIIRAIITTITENLSDSQDIACMAPTGRAARRMKEATGHDAFTIHKFLNRLYNTSDKLAYQYIIVDEASMIDIKLAYRLLSVVDAGAQVIFLGDNDQLPPIGPGVFFRDLLMSHACPVVRLKNTFRYGGSIAANADKINNGMGVHSYNTDDAFQVIKANKDDGPKKAIDTYIGMVEEFGLQESVILSPTRNRSEGATNQLNKAIQKLLFPSRSPDALFKTFDFEIGTGDRVMLTKNNIVEDHANGDTGTVVEVTERYVSVLFDGDTEPVEMKNEDAKLLVLAYAISIHKSQGSQYSGVVIIFTSEHTFMGERALLYTAATRAKTKLRLVCDARAVAQAVAKVKQITRNSKLKERLQ